MACQHCGVLLKQNEKICSACGRPRSVAPPALPQINAPTPVQRGAMGGPPLESGQHAILQEGPPQSAPPISGQHPQSMGRPTPLSAQQMYTAQANQIMNQPASNQAPPTNQQQAPPSNQYQVPPAQQQKKYNFLEKAAAMETMMSGQGEGIASLEPTQQPAQQPMQPTQPPAQQPMQPMQPQQPASIAQAVGGDFFDSAPRNPQPELNSPGHPGSAGSIGGGTEKGGTTETAGTTAGGTEKNESAESVWHIQSSMFSNLTQLEQAFALPQSNDPFALHPLPDAQDIDSIPGFGFADVANSTPTMSVSGREDNLSRIGYASSILDPVVASPTDAANFIKRTFQSTIGSESALLSSDQLTFSLTHWSADGYVDPYPVAAPPPVRSDDKKEFKTGEVDPFASPWEEVNSSGASFLSSRNPQLSSGLAAGLAGAVSENASDNPDDPANQDFGDYSHLRGLSDGSSRLASLRSAKPESTGSAISSEESRELVRSQFRKGANRDRFGAGDSQKSGKSKTGVLVTLLLICGLAAAGTFAVLNMGAITSLMSSITGGATNSAAINPNARVGGQWHVSMFLEDGTGARSAFQEFDVIVSEDGLRLFGSGNDQEGPYTIEGTFTEDNAISFKKKYSGASRFRLPIAFSGQLTQGQGDALATGHFYAHLVEGNQSLSGIFELRRGLRSQSRASQWNS